MAERASLRDALEQLVLAGVGSVALTAERADRLAADLAAASGLRRDEARGLVDQLARRWRGDAVRAGERAGAAMDGLFREVGLVTRDEYEELELRVAQLEHRLQLVERDGARPPRP